MDAQLTLIDTEPRDWRLDEHTREVGLRGVADARRALAAAHRDVTEVTGVTADTPIGRRTAA